MRKALTVERPTIPGRFQALRSGEPAARLQQAWLALLVLGPVVFLPSRITEPFGPPAELWIAVMGWAFICMVTVRGLRPAAKQPPAVYGLVALGSWVLARGAFPSVGEHGRYAMTVATYIALGLATRAWLATDTEARRASILRLCVAVVAVQIVVGAFQFMGVALGSWAPAAIRESVANLDPVTGHNVSGTLGNTNFVGELVAICAPAAAGWLLSSEARRGRRLGLLFSGASAMLLLATACRAALLGTIAGAVVASAGAPLRRFRASRRVLAACALGAVPIAFAARNLIEKFRYVKLTDTVTPRLIVWKASLVMWWEQPLLGTGLGGFKVLVTDVLARFHPGRLSPALTSGRFEAAHNELLQALAELGPVGASLAALVLVLCFRGVRRNSSLPGPLRAGLLWGMSVLVVTSSVGLPLHVPVTALVVVLLLAVGLSRPEEPREVGPARALAGAVATALVGILVVARGAWPLFHASRLCFRGAEREGIGDWQAAQSLYAWSAERDRFKAPARFLQMRALAQQRLYDDALRVFDLHRSEGLGMDAVLLRANLLTAVGRLDEAKRAYQEVIDFYHPSHRHHQHALRLLQALTERR
jgi:O-antigen ligase